MASESIVAGIIIPALSPSCGNCLYHEPTPDLQTIACKGVPPTPIMMGAQQTAMGMQLDIRCFWPQVPRDTKGCALWKAKKLN